MGSNNQLVKEIAFGWISGSHWDSLFSKYFNGSPPPHLKNYQILGKQLGKGMTKQ